VTAIDLRLDPDIAAQFARDGYILLKSFYDYEQEIVPIQEGIRSIISLVAQKYELDLSTDTYENAIVRSYPSLIAKNRAYGSEIYDAVKQIPAFLRLVSNPRNTALFTALRPGSQPGIAGGGFGIRIDNPNEEKFKAPWHQEFPAQLRSLDGVVFWSPLLPVSPEMGPVKLCPGSQKEGLVPVYEDDGGIGKTGAYALRLDRESERLALYEQIQPLTTPGDLLVMDFLTLHASGTNISDRPRVTMQWRLFNFRDPTGVKLGWKGSFAAGVKYENALPELVASR
jgi:ectoine hydroxylase-related dioxygenase (phytanoyl-CoA dioxygenase family)